jgi:hypothetical protein
MIHDKYFNDAFILHDPTNDALHWQSIMHHMASSNNKNLSGTKSKVAEFFKNQPAFEIDSNARIHLFLFNRTIVL